MFASTSRLNLRAYRESDREHVLAMSNDPRIMHTLTYGYVVPKGPSNYKAFEDEVVTKALLFVMVEVKPEFGDLRDVHAEDESALSPKEDGGQPDLFVGHCAVFLPVPKNRDVTLGIALRPCWWGKGLGSEVVRWAVDYAFHQLDMHRVSLYLFGNNERALALYKKVGFVEECRKRAGLFQHGKWVDDVHMGILVDDWKARRIE